MTVLFGTNTHNPHAVQMALALQEAGLLYAYATGGVDRWRTPFGRGVRQIVARIPALDRELRKRRIDGLDDSRVHAHWGWEALRVVCARAVRSPRITDWVWERGEHALDRACATTVTRPDVDAFIGVEHGALAALQAARRTGKPGGLVFMSPHHRTYARWVAPEFEAFPELRSAAQAHLAALAVARDARRDAEMALADCLFSNSSFTTRSLVDAGVDPTRIVTIPLGCDATSAVTPVSARRRTGTVRVMFAGPLSVRKGGHHLLDAWSAIGGDVELHCYGSIQLPTRVIDSARRRPGGFRVHLHGSVDGSTLRRAYDEADVLVLPTLCDGFGLVIGEALSAGLPVITTTNAGAADLVEHGRSGLIIPPADRDALVGALTWAVDHPADLRAMREAARTTASRHGWDQFRASFADHVQRRFTQLSASPVRA